MMWSPSLLSHQIKSNLVRVLLDSGALQFGDFNTKSARRTPYFIDTSSLYQSLAWESIIKAYVYAAHHHISQPLDAVYGHAYKGIPLCASFSVLYSQITGKQCHFFFNRKEAKTHGEKGVILGKTQLLKNKKIVICDDVLTSGKSLKEAISTLSDHHLHSIIAAVVLVDRQECSDTHPHISAKQAFEQDFQVPVINLITISEIITELIRTDEPTAKPHIESIQNYLNTYGITSTSLISQ